jgi:anthranilate synthase component 1
MGNPDSGRLSRAAGPINRNLVESKPVAGTRPRGENYQEDLRLEKDLLGDEKEKAEHLCW